MKKRFLAFSLVLLLCLLCAVPAMAAVDLDEPDYVVDDAGVLSDETEQHIRSVNALLEANCRGAQFVVITTPYAPRDMDQQEFASEIFYSWNVGDAYENNGFVLVLFTEKNEFWIEIGEDIRDNCYDELKGIYDSENSSFCQNVKKGKFDKAVEIALDETVGVLKKFYRASTHNSSYSSGSSYSGAETTGTSPAKAAGGSFILLLIILFFVLRSRRRNGRSNSGLFSGMLLGYLFGRNRGNSGYSSGRPTPPPPGRFGSSHTYGSSSFRPSGHSSSFRSSGSSSRGSGFGSSSRSGGFSSSRSSGSSFRGGGGHSGGGFGKR